MTNMDIGTEPEARAEIAEGLSRLLADSYTLYLKTHNYHWNVTGPMFGTLHLMFEQQYTELALAVDLIAERAATRNSPSSPRSVKMMTSPMPARCCGGCWRAKRPWSERRATRSASRSGLAISRAWTS